MLCAVGLAPPPGDPVSERRSLPPPSPPRPLPQHLGSGQWGLLWSQSLSGLASLFSCCLIVSQYYYFFQRTLPPHDVPEVGRLHSFVIWLPGYSLPLLWDPLAHLAGGPGTAELSSNLFQMHPFLLSALFASVLDMVSMVPRVWRALAWSLRTRLCS